MLIASSDQNLSVQNDLLWRVCTQVGRVLISGTTVDLPLNQLPPNEQAWFLLPESIYGGNAVEECVIPRLDRGWERVLLSVSSNEQPAKELLAQLPEHVGRDRMGIYLDLTKSQISTVTPWIALVGSVLLDISVDQLPQLVEAVKPWSTTTKVAVKLVDAPIADIASTIAQLDIQNIDVLLPTTVLSTADQDGHLSVGKALWSTLQSDRQDGLVPTVVTDIRGNSLGLVYSSEESQGVYQSRKRGLWHKGATSGDTQKLIQIKVDCDRDAIQFIVEQTGHGFCHLGTQTCFGKLSGLSALEAVLQSRRENAPAGSYTRRLFDDVNLLTAKIKEEADELCDATTPKDIAWEAADLIYFALTRCVASGVSLHDVEQQLDARSQKVTRRPGNAKPAYITQVVSKPEETFTSLSMQKLVYANMDAVQRSALLQRPITSSDDIIAKVKPIMDSVRKQGDAAIVELTKKFDGAELDSVVIKAPFAEELMQLDPETRAAIDDAYNNIYKFHEAQLHSDPVLSVETAPGVVCSRFARPIERVGLYVPGGTAVLPSTALMLGIPAKVAGCHQIIIASPPRKDGTCVPEVLYVAHKVGAEAVVLAGGAQAVAALAYGTASVPKVDKICGPGNQFVTAAKMIAQNDSSAMVSIDMPAGPSELLVIADATANPAYVVADLLSQAEHGPDSQVVLVMVAPTPDQIAAVEHELYTQAHRLPRRAILYSLSGHCRRSICFFNAYAPEHLILHMEEADRHLDSVFNAGSVFVGHYSPESCGDYASGTNHTLPTYGYARMYSGVNTDTFLKYITSQHLTAEGLADLAIQ
ncbi:histidinol dehydrogenase-domain-containing protein [Syncephalis fuscata]|nr:histidinol dehydrogenase-domain-containing protein [Syncephalis fuscata]